MFLSAEWRLGILGGEGELMCRSEVLANQCSVSSFRGVNGLWWAKGLDT